MMMMMMMKVMMKERRIPHSSTHSTNPLELMMKEQHQDHNSLSHPPQALLLDEPSGMTLLRSDSPTTIAEH
jgi:hypothetical protein